MNIFGSKSLQSTDKISAPRGFEENIGTVLDVQLETSHNRNVLSAPVDKRIPLI